MDFKNVGKLVVGVVVFMVVLQVLQMTNLMAFAVDKGVDSGKLGADSAPVATTALEIGSALLSGVVFLLTRLGSASIAFITALVSGSGPVSQSPVVTAKEDLRKDLAYHLFNKALEGDVDAIRVFTEFLSGGKEVFTKEQK